MWQRILKQSTMSHQMGELTQLMSSLLPGMCSWEGHSKWWSRRKSWLAMKSISRRSVEEWISCMQDLAKLIRRYPKVEGAWVLSKMRKSASFKRRPPSKMPPSNAPSMALLQSCLIESQPIASWAYSRDSRWVPWTLGLQVWCFISPQYADLPCLRVMSKLRLPQFTPLCPRQESNQDNWASI